MNATVRSQLCTEDGFALMISNVRGLVWLPLVVSVGCGESDSGKEPVDSTPTTVSPTTNAGASTDDSPSTSQSDEESTGGSDDGAGTTTDSETSEDESITQGVQSLGARCDRATRLGGVSVKLGSDRTVIAGNVSNGVLPTSVPKVETEGGGCELLVPRDLFCSTCATDEVCAGDDTCVPKPSKVSAGILSLEGLLVEADVSPNSLTLDYSKTLLDPYPAYDVGTTISFKAAGDVIPAFEAEVYRVPELVSDLSVVNVKHGEPTQLAWDSDTANPDQSSVFITFSVNVHGAVTGWIECTAPDTGAFEIPAEMVSALIDLGLSGFPRVDLERRSSATVELEQGCIDVYAGSNLRPEIEVDGLVSCNEDPEIARTVNPARQSYPASDFVRLISANVLIPLQRSNTETRRNTSIETHAVWYRGTPGTPRGLLEHGRRRYQRRT